MKSLQFVLVLFVFSIPFLFAGGQGEDGQDQVTMRVGDIEKTGNLSAQGIDKALGLIEEKSGGSIKTKIFHDSQLGSASKQLELVKSGTLEMFRGGIGWLSAYNGAYSIFSYPYVFETGDDIVKVLESPLGEELNNELIKEYGI